MNERCQLLAAFVRGLSDDDLNDLLVELPKDRFAAVLDATLAAADERAGLAGPASPEQAA
jgi:hypothetical protein